MKHTRRLFAMILCAALLGAVWVPLSGAEPVDALSSLTQGVGMPGTYTLDVTPLPAEGADAALKEWDGIFTAASGESLRVQLQLSFFGFENLEAEWTQRAQEYTQNIARLISGETSIDPRSLAGEVKAELDSMHLSGAQPSAGATVRIHSVQVTAPYYEELQNGSRGDAVVKLQQRLIELGFLDDGADGQFGPATKKGVEALQAHIRALEQEIIDERAPEPTPAPTPDASGETPEPPQPEPKPEPATQIDGIASAELQAYLYSDQFSIAGPTIRPEDKGDAVLRLQKRLINLGCLTGKPDGYFGGDTQRGVRIFQHYNGLSETGVADRNTQLALFGKDAKSPDYPLMTEGSKGDEVRLLQERLRQLGFMTDSADGGYGSATATGVKNLQTYLNSMQANAGETGYEINGVADPMLQEAFFADSFPAIPDIMQKGAKGPDVERLQRRLYDLEYLFIKPDGDYGSVTEKAIAEFQKRNKLTETGKADAQTLAVVFSRDPKKALKPYVLKVSIEKQRVYAYAPDANEEYTRLVRTMKCSTGLAATPTIKGTFQASTGPGARWHYFKKFKCWAQYAYSIQGDYLFHSVLYGSKGGNLYHSSVNNLGRRASHGCVRLAVEDAKWIWTNCPKRTKVIVY